MKIVWRISVSSLMPTYKEQQILDKVCKVTRQKQIKYYDFIPFSDFQYEKFFQLSALPLFTLLRGPCIYENIYAYTVKRQRGKFPWDLYWENKTYKLKRFIVLCFRHTMKLMWLDYLTYAELLSCVSIVNYKEVGRGWGWQRPLILPLFGRPWSSQLRNLSTIREL